MTLTQLVSQSFRILMSLRKHLELYEAGGSVFCSKSDTWFSFADVDDWSYTWTQVNAERRFIAPVTFIVGMTEDGMKNIHANLWSLVAGHGVFDKLD